MKKVTLNWLHSHGYTEQLGEIEYRDRGVLSITFSRSSPVSANESETSVFTPNVKRNHAKEFVMIEYLLWQEIMAIMILHRQKR